MIVYFYFDEGKLTFEPNGVCPADMEPEVWAAEQFHSKYGFAPLDWAWDYEVVD